MTSLNPTTEPPHTDPELAEELLSMAKHQQATLTPDHEDVTDVTILFDHADRIVEIVRSHGWPTQMQVGADAIQFAGNMLLETDVEFQRSMIEHLRSLPTEQSNVMLSAILEDRVCVRSNKPQIYGTQVTRATGIWELKPVIEPEKLDERRKEVGLKPVAEFLQELNAPVS